MSKTFVPLVEHNDWEGETWTFWLQVEGNEDELVKLYQWISGYELEETFELDVNDRESEDVVDRMVERATVGYNYSDNKIVGKLNLPEVKSEEELRDLLYKGGIEDYFKEGK